MGARNGRRLMEEKRASTRVDAVVIGRNEGERLLRCLRSLQGRAQRLVYVDSGSADGSAGAAREMGAEVVLLDPALPFTAARARNAGLALLAADPPGFVQFVDGDCEVDAGWIDAALAAFAEHPAAVAVCGRRRERHPDASLWNALADREWDTPVGPARACGGDVMMRYAAVQAAGGYRESLIAGEEPELCLRLIRAGGEVWRIAAEMTLHDAAMTRMSQWWRRCRRAGHAFAEGAALHGAGPERHWVAETRRALLWGAGLPVLILLAGLLHPLGWALALAYPAQVVRLSRRGGLRWAFFTTLAKFAEAQGVLGYGLDRLRGRRRALIEYK
jgi:GT2 family glycosyltransferase